MKKNRIQFLLNFNYIIIASLLIYKKFDDCFMQSLSIDMLATELLIQKDIPQFSSLQK